MADILDIARQDVIMGAVENIFGTPRFGNGSLVSSDMILSVRGTFYWVSLSDNSSPGMYAIDELTRYIRQQTAPELDPGGELSLPTQNNAVPPILLTSVDFTQSDITSEIPCLNNVKIFYTFGQNFGQVQIAGEVLLGPLGNDQQHNVGFKIIHDFFFKYRVSRFKQPIAVSIANESFFVYLKGLRIGQIDPSFHIMPFMFFGTLLDISREDANLVNPSSTVITTGNVDDASLIAAIQASQPDELVIKDTTVTANDVKPPNTNFDVSFPGSQGSSTTTTATSNAGTVKEANAAAAAARINGTETPEMKQYQQLRDTQSSMQNERAGFAANPANADIVAASQSNFDAQMTSMTSARSELANVIVQQANNQPITPITVEATTTLQSYGINPLAAQTDPEFATGRANETNLARANAVATGQSVGSVPKPLISPPVQYRPRSIGEFQNWGGM